MLARLTATGLVPTVFENSNCGYGMDVRHDISFLLMIGRIFIAEAGLFGLSSRQLLIHGTFIRYSTPVHRRRGNSY